jgi:pyruvate/2-oxoglutarate dehydrogenase complex dihydrolipoamide acyltransferase (E2) component
MYFLQVNDLPWKGREVSSFPALLTNTIADVATETYQYDGGTISIAVKERADVGRVIAAINMSMGSTNAFSILKEDGEVITAGRTPAAQPQPQAAAPMQPVAPPEAQPTNPTPPPAPEPVAMQQPQMAPAPAQPVAPAAPAVAYPAVVARTNETNPQIRNSAEVFGRTSIPDERLEQHLFGLKNANTNAQVRELNQALNEYRQYMEAITSKMRRINELSAVAQNDDAVKSVIRQIRAIAAGMPDNKIEDVFVTASYIVFKTTAIRMLNSRTNKHHLLGRVMIVVPLATMMGQDTMPLYFQPLDLVYKGDARGVSYFVPHVSGSGSYCYGNATDAFIEAVVKRDLVCLIDVAIRFLENPNMNDGMGVVASQWPVLED